MDIKMLMEFPQAKYLLKNVFSCRHLWQKNPVEKKNPLTSINPFQKGESVGLAWTCESILPRRYLLCNSSCHTSFSFRSLNSHLLSKHLFVISSTSMPRPP